MFVDDNCLFIIVLLDSLFDYTKLLFEKTNKIFCNTITIIVVCVRRVYIEYIDCYLLINDISLYLLQFYEF